MNGLWHETLKGVKDFLGFIPLFFYLVLKYRITEYDLWIPLLVAFGVTFINLRKNF